MIKSKVPSHSVLYAERKKQVYLGSMRFDAILDCLTTRHGDLRGKAECYCESGLYFILYAYSSKSLRAWGAVYISPGGRSSCKPPGLEHCLKLGVPPRSAQPSQHDPPTAVASSHWSIGTCQIMSWNGLSRYKRIASNFRSVAFPLSFSHAAVVKGSSLDKKVEQFPGSVFRLCRVGLGFMFLGQIILLRSRGTLHRRDCNRPGSSPVVGLDQESVAQSGAGN